MNEENSGSQKCDFPVRGGAKSRFVAYLLGILHIRGTSIAGVPALVVSERRQFKGTLFEYRCIKS